MTAPAPWRAAPLAFALAVGGVAAVAAPASPDTVSPATPWDLRLEAGRRAPTSVTVVNRCRSGQRFDLRVDPPVSWFAVDDGGGIEVPPMETVPVAAEVATMGLEPGFYETRLAVRCRACAAEPGCRQDEDRFAVRLAVPWSGEELRRLEDEPRVVPGVLLAVLPALPAGELRRAVRGLERSLGLAARRRFRLATVDGELVVFEIPGRPALPLLGPLAAAPGVLWAQPSFVHRAQAAEGDPLADVQYGLAMVRAREAHSRVTGRGVRVAVIDGAVALHHPDLANRVVESRSFLAGEARGPAAREEGPAYGHGTAVAGLIAAARGNGVGIFGVAPEVDLLAYQACSVEAGEAGASCASESVARAIDAAVIARARVVNLSLGGPRDPLLARLAREAERRGAVLVAAAGNNGPGGPPLFPAALPEVVAVTAVDAAGAIYAAAARGPAVDCAAPGVEVLAPGPDGGFSPVTGTSMAAAHVSGLVALLLEAAPDLTPAEVRAALARAAADRGEPGRDPVFGDGLVNACELLRRAAPGMQACPPAPDPPRAAPPPG